MKVKDQRGNSQMSKSKRQKRIATIEEAFHKNEAWSLRALLAEIGISHVTWYRIITWILKLRKLSLEWTFRKLSLGQLECV